MSANDRRLSGDQSCDPRDRERERVRMCLCSEIENRMKKEKLSEKEKNSTQEIGGGFYAEMLIFVLMLLHCSAF